MADARERALENYRKKLMEHRELDAKLKEVRETEKKLMKDYEKSENDLKALQSVGQIVGEVLKQLTEEKFIVKVFYPLASNFNLFRLLTVLGMLLAVADKLIRPSSSQVPELHWI